jgi:hypothetical protein
MMVDAYLRRPEGLIYAVDAAGLPCFMTSLNPSYAVSSSQAIYPGMSVSVALSGAPLLTQDVVGEVLIVDQANPNLTEACVIQSVNGTTLVLQQVTQTHAAGVLMQAGLVIKEEKKLPEARALFRASRPVVRLLSGLGRYGYGRRSDQQAGLFEDINLLAIIGTFGGPPLWLPFDVTQCGIAWNNQREVWVPAGVFMAPYNECRMAYVSGFSASGLPDPIKAATAEVCVALTDLAGSGNIKRFKAGQTDIERFTNQSISEDTRRLLLPFRAATYV